MRNMCLMVYFLYICFFLFFFSSRRRHTRCALVTGVQTCALPTPAEHHPQPSHPRAHRGSCLDAPRLQRIEPMTKDLSYPLHWPASWPRARGRSEAKFGQKAYSKAYQTTKRVTIATALDRLEAELTRLGSRGIDRKSTRLKSHT